MRCLILSDLHLEIWRDQSPAFDAAACQADVVVLAGDIHTGPTAVEWAARQFPRIPVVYVHGNHEGYGYALEAMWREIDEACQQCSNIHFLNCGEFRYGQVRFLGATLWTDFDLFGRDKRMAAMWDANEVMNDYRRIRLEAQDNRRLRADDTALLHREHKAWLQQQLDQPFDGKTVVVTHMAPSMVSVPDRYRDHLVSAAYASRLEDMAMAADVWVHGHTHDSFDYRIGPCRVVCNPRGYTTYSGKPENARFDPNFVIEL